MDFLTFADHVRTGGVRYSGSVISWGRSQKRNEEVGGHPDSFHMSWLAADVVFDEPAGMNLCWKFWVRMGLHVKKNGEKTLHVQVVPPILDHQLKNKGVPV